MIVCNNNKCVGARTEGRNIRRPRVRSSLFDDHFVERIYGTTCVSDLRRVFLCMLGLTRIGRLLVALRYSMYFRLYEWHHMELYRSTGLALFDDHLGDILVVVVEGSNDFIQSTHDHRAHARKKTGAKIGRVVSEICSRTDGRTDGHMTTMPWVSSTVLRHNSVDVSSWRNFSNVRFTSGFVSNILQSK